MARGRDAAGTATALGQRLRALREAEFTRLTQDELARALGQPLSVATISMWESSGRIPPPARLSAYARLFCTPRSFEGGDPRLLAESDLRQDERARMQALEQELLDLRDRALAGMEQTGLWHFADGHEITLVCAVLPKEDRPKYADREHRDYVRAASWADVDTVINLYGHIRAENPSSSVQIRPLTELDNADTKGHIVVVGGAAWNKATEQFSEQLALPVRQLVGKGNIFMTEVDELREFAPTWMDQEGERGLKEDVGLFVRAPNPQAPRRSLSICNGVTTRGVEGAAIAFTDPELRERNEQYVAGRFGPGASFCIVMRIRVVNRRPLTPDLSDGRTVLFEWSDQE